MRTALFAVPMMLLCSIGDTTADDPKPIPKEKVFKKAEDLFAEVPKDALDDPTSLQLWCKEFAVVRPFEWTATVTGVRLDGDGPYLVELYTDEKRVTRANRFQSLDFLDFGGPFKIRGEPAELLTRYDQLYNYPECTLAEAKRLNGFKGQKVTFRGTFLKLSGGKRDKADGYTFYGQVSPPAVNGFLPEASKPRPRM